MPVERIVLFIQLSHRAFGVAVLVPTIVFKKHFHVGDVDVRLSLVHNLPFLVQNLDLALLLILIFMRRMH